MRRPSWSAFDAVKDSITIVSPVRPQAGVAAKAALARAVDRLSAVVDALDQPLDKSAPLRNPTLPASREGLEGDVPPHSNTRRPSSSAWCCGPRTTSPPATFFQVVLSQRFEAPFSCRRSRCIGRCGGSSVAVFVLLDFGGFAVAGSSPEILVKTANGIVTSARFAGTRHRGATRTRIKRSKPSCWPIRKNAPSI